MAGEVLPYVQGESLKGSAAVLRRFVNSPVTSASLVTAPPQAGSSPLMEPQDYSLAADALAKFQSSPEWIKALCLILPSALLFGMTWCLADMAKTIARALLLRRVLRAAPVLVAAEPGRPLIARPKGEIFVLRPPAPAEPDLAEDEGGG